MKRVLTLLLASLMIFVLAACAEDTSSTESAEDTENTESTESTDDAEATDDAGSAADSVNLEEVYEKAIARQSEIKSMSSDMVMEQKMVFEESGDVYEMGSKSNLTADFTLDPIASKMEGTVSSVDPSTGENIEAEMNMYMLSDVIYMYEATSDAWIELPTEGMEEILQQANQMDASEQLKQLSSLISEFSMGEEGDEYILTLDAAGDKFTEFVIEQMALLESVGVTEAEEDIMAGISYDKVHYVLNINKDTYDMTAMDMVLHMSLEEGDENLVIETESQMTFSNFDGIEEIEVPQEVIDNAVQMEF